MLSMLKGKGTEWLLKDSDRSSWFLALGESLERFDCL